MLVLEWWLLPWLPEPLDPDPALLPLGRLELRLTELLGIPPQLPVLLRPLLEPGNEVVLLMLLERPPVPGLLLEGSELDGAAPLPSPLGEEVEITTGPPSAPVAESDWAHAPTLVTPARTHASDTR